MKKVLITLGVFLILFVIDFICIFTISRPLFAIQNGNKYVGLFYDTYNCSEYAVPQVKSKWTKFSCVDNINIIKKIDVIIDKTKSIEGFMCAEVLEQFYEDGEYTYYFSCAKSEFVVVKYLDGSEDRVNDALKNGTIQIEDLDDYNIKYYKYKK